jgi:polyisoprenoid-binding protein YceI
MLTADQPNRVAAPLTRVVAAVLSFTLVAFSRPAQAELMHFAIDPAASRISATVREPLSSLRGEATGSFRIISGEIVSDSADPSRSTTVKIEVDTASYSSGSSLRDRTVTGSILDAENYPTITFQGGDVDNIVRTGDTDGTATIRGSLTLHGVTRAVIVPVAVHLTDDRKLRADGEVTINYPDWAIEVPTMLFGAMRAGDQATIRFHIVAARDSS